MLQRIYGTSFFTKKELDEHLKKLEEARLRDHRKLGKELDLFSVADEIGGGLILWHPKGAIVRKTIEDFGEKSISKTAMNLFLPLTSEDPLCGKHRGISIFTKRICIPEWRWKSDFLCKPMNCPFHVMITNQSIEVTESCL